MTDEGEVRLDMVSSYVDHFVKFGVPNAFVTGTTGEGNSMTLAERKSVAEAWVNRGKGRLSAIIIHIGAGNLKDAKELASHAQEIGADAIACVGPTYHKPETLEQYVYYMRDVAAAAPETPFLLYDIDFVTGIHFGVSDFFNLARVHIPTLRGVKHTSPDLVSMSNSITDHNGQYQILMGTDELYLAGLVTGVDSTIMNSYLGNVLNRVQKAFDQGDMASARLDQERAIAVCNLRRKYGFSIPGGTKAILRAVGLDVGQPRCPLEPISQETVDKLKADLTNIGYFNWGMNP